VHRTEKQARPTIKITNPKSKYIKPVAEAATKTW